MTERAGSAGGAGAGARPLGDLLTRCEFPDPDSGPVTLAVSGGADSMALLVLAARSGLAGTAVHVDHGLRPDSAREADVVAAAAAAFGLAFEARTVTVEPGPDLEARARSARYEALRPGVLTGHTMDDQAETVLLNLLRGAGLNGLAGMRGGAPGPAPAVRRPLLRLRRAETAALCASVGLVPVEDPTNADPRFRRNRIRAEVLPLLAEVAERDVVPVLARQADLMAAEAAALDGLAAALDPTDAAALRSAPVAVARRAVRQWLRSDAGYPDRELHPPSAAEVARVLAVASGDAIACELSAGRRVRRSRGRLEVLPGPADR